MEETKKVGRPRRFQFLIGTIKTNISPFLFLLYFLFQFLIGTIKTKLYNDKLTVTYIVSIPYRYDKNATTTMLLHQDGNSFNSL